MAGVLCMGCASPSPPKMASGFPMQLKTSDINASFEIIFDLTFHMLLHTSSEVMVDTKNCSLNIQDH